MWLPFLDNRGLGTAAWRVVYNSVLLVTASAAFLKTPKRVLPVILLYGMGFFWGASSSSASSPSRSSA